MLTKTHGCLCGCVDGRPQNRHRAMRRSADRCRRYSYQVFYSDRPGKQVNGPHWNE